MENIRQAVERARTPQNAGLERSQVGLDVSQRNRDSDDRGKLQSEAQIQEAVLSSAYLQSRRIISHLAADPRSKSFDMLRTQVLQSMDLKGWRTLAVTSPTADCGKTVTALNLAISIARQSERSVLLVDLDFQKPAVATTLGLKMREEGALSVLQGKTTLSRAIIPVRVGEQRFSVLPTTSTTGSAELIASRAMAAMIQDLKREYHSQIIILDLPPVLTSDDVIAVLPQMDCVLFVAAVGTSTIAQIEECRRHLQSSEVVRIILNKVPVASTNYYYQLDRRN